MCFLLCLWLGGPSRALLAVSEAGASCQQHVHVLVRLGARKMCITPGPGPRRGARDVRDNRRATSRSETDTHRVMTMLNTLTRPRTHVRRT